MTDKFFASDNCATVHPLVMQRMAEINKGHVVSYGEDEYTESVLRRVEAEFGGNCSAYFVLSGTGANATCLTSMCPSWGAVICTRLAHINNDETGAFEHLTGGKIYAVSGGRMNKVTPDEVEPHLAKLGVQHANQPKVISITQCTETGTVYTLDEIKALSDLAHANGMTVHMDGARFANAVVALGCTPAQMTADAGVDMLSFGMSKNGAMFGEAVVCFADIPQFKYVRKNCTQLISKNRFIAAQFEAMMKDALWLDCARNANAMAKRISDGLCALPGVSAMWPTEANEAFITLPKRVIEPLREYMNFFDADEGENTVRLVASYDTTAEEVDAFIAKAKELIL